MKEEGAGQQSAQDRYEQAREQRRGKGRDGGAQPNGSQPRPWPELASEALYGLTGDVVRTVGPETEADPVAIMIQFHVFFGNAIGRRPYFLVEGTNHFTNLFAILAGESSKSRKGTSADRIKQLFEVADPTWVLERIGGGLSSGEGLIFQVRDAVKKINKKGDEEIVDPGVNDKRLLVDEREFFQALSTMKRETNPVSRVVREAWDGREFLGSMTKTSPTHATGALISIVGHITEEELRKHLDSTSLANGYANRFLFVCVRRARFLPEGGNLDDNAVRRLGAKIGRAMSQAKSIRRMTRTDAAREIWAKVYGKLSEGQPGMLGSVIGRAEAQVLRLSMLYALLDGKNQIGVPHLQAALAVWDYCEASARRIFGDAVGDPVADMILSMLRNAGPQGMTRTELSNALGRHRNSTELGTALGVLLRAGKARFERKTDGPWRPTEVWFAV